MKKTVFLFFILMLCLFTSPAQAETSESFSYTIENGQAKIIAYTGSASNLTIPDMLGGYPVTAINYCAFRNCTSLVQITLPDGITTIGSNAFQNCASLIQVNLPDSLVSIGTHAFYGCAALTQITLPESIERLHPYTFYGCSAVRLCSHLSHAARILTDYGYAFTSPDYPQLSLMAYENDAGMRIFTVTDCDESAVHVTFPEDTAVIDGYAFFGCDSLTEITIPDSVTEIAYSAFEGCTALTQITLPGSVVRIAENAFPRAPGMTLIAPEGSAAHQFAEASPGNSLIWQPM